MVVQDAARGSKGGRAVVLLPRSPNKGCKTLLSKDHPTANPLWIQTRGPTKKPDLAETWPSFAPKMKSNLGPQIGTTYGPFFGPPLRRICKQVSDSGPVLRDQFWSQELDPLLHKMCPKSVFARVCLLAGGVGHCGFAVAWALGSMILRTLSQNPLPTPNPNHHQPAHPPKTKTHTQNRDGWDGWIMHSR